MDINKYLISFVKEDIMIIIPFSSYCVIVDTIIVEQSNVISLLEHIYQKLKCTLEFDIRCCSI